MILDNEQHTRRLYMVRQHGKTVAKGWSFIHLVYAAAEAGVKLIESTTHWVGSDWISSDLPKSR